MRHAYRHVHRHVYRRVYRHVYSDTIDICIDMPSTSTTCITLVRSTGYGIKHTVDHMLSNLLSIYSAYTVDHLSKYTVDRLLSTLLSISPSNTVSRLIRRLPQKNLQLSGTTLRDFKSRWLQQNNFPPSQTTVPLDVADFRHGLGRMWLLKGTWDVWCRGQALAANAWSTFELWKFGTQSVPKKLFLLGKARTLQLNHAYSAPLIIY